jgi:hypothetical protein
MTVQELIEELQDMAPDAEVHFQYNYGDYWRTQVAPEVGTVETANVVWSDYHSMPKIIDDDGTRDMAEAKQVVVIRK